MLIEDAFVKIFGGAIGTALLGWVVRAYIRRFSRDRVEGARDLAEIDVIAVLREENKMLRAATDQAYRERNEAVQELGGLRTEVRLLREHVQRLEQSIQQWREHAAPPQREQTPPTS